MFSTMNQGINKVWGELSFGIFLPQIYKWPEMLQHAQHIENLGFSSLWIADHFVNPYDHTADWFECWTTLAALAASTKKIRLGTAVTHIVYRNPAMLARMALTVDHISNGRLEFGIGVGSPGDFNYGMTGIQSREKIERMDRYFEAVELIDQLLRNDVTNFEGDYYWVREAQMHPKPIQKPRPPFSLAAHYPRSLKFAAKFADSWNSFYPGDNLTPEESSRVIGEKNSLLSQFAVELGRDPATIRRTFFVGYSSDSPFESDQAFIDFLNRYREAGIQEFILGYIPGRSELFGKWIIDEKSLEMIAQQLL